ncbi:MAG: hypothetical protein IPI65_16210 [Bacteroidetes bacterium]|nr:hypothetical protein [Bacteroidota bacterium]
MSLFDDHHKGMFIQDGEIPTFPWQKKKLPGSWQTSGSDIKAKAQLFSSGMAAIIRW